ncbi:hypothetical protein NDU88_002243 [Pleurodeles waltl]|uniref:Uncharacterized protein n=1 Tax=Pleurodeles waltl TaxID=8319 RepID=A0AAV7LNR7_PLEWA|nr:hypothetical protein NDU88_002243 [Pleurodeles waltl]
MSGPSPKESGPQPLYRPREARNVYWYWDLPGPTASVRLLRHFRLAAAPGRHRHRTRAAHPALNVARSSTQGRSANQEEGPQASARAGGFDAVKSPRPDLGQGSTAPLVCPDCRARTPVRDSPGWRAY